MKYLTDYELSILCKLPHSQIRAFAQINDLKVQHGVLQKEGYGWDNINMVATVTGG